MTTSYQKRLSNYYLEKQIHPEHFNCPNQSTCRQFANQGNMTETKMSMVGSKYGEKYPKIVVVSLDPPSGKNKKNENKRWEFIIPNQRTTEFVSTTHEKDDYTSDHENQHWAMTQIIVKDLLLLWGYEPQANVATVLQSYVGVPIENVSAYFAHVNVAKCSMNNSGQRQAAKIVQKICSNAFLHGELILLEPDILITQGDMTNRLLGNMLVGSEILTSDLPRTEQIYLKKKQVFWMSMHHPTQQLGKIRKLWPDYLISIKQWKNKS